MTGASKYSIHTIVITVYNKIFCLAPTSGDDFSFTSTFLPLCLASVPSTWSMLNKSFMKGGRNVHLSFSLPGFPAFPHPAPYLTSFPTTLHYTPFAVVKPVSPRHPTHFSGAFSSCWNALLPLLHLFILLMLAPSFPIRSSSIC